jgi:hypothetical protein
LLLNFGDFAIPAILAIPLSVFTRPGLPWISGKVFAFPISLFQSALIRADPQ